MHSPLDFILEDPRAESNKQGEKLRQGEKLSNKYVKIFILNASGCCIVILPTRNSSANHIYEESISHRCYIIVLDTHFRILIKFHKTLSHFNVLFENCMLYELLHKLRNYIDIE